MTWPPGRISLRSESVEKNPHVPALRPFEISSPYSSSVMLSFESVPTFTGSAEAIPAMSARRINADNILRIVINTSMCNFGYGVILNHSEINST